MSKVYIERGALIDYTNNHVNCTIDSNDIARFPAADVVEVKHGTWQKRQAIIFDSELTGYRCSECKTTWDAENNYCPNCGADMRGVNDGE